MWLLQVTMIGAGIFVLSGIAAKASPNIETSIFQDLDLSLIRRQREHGSVMNWLDRRSDLYQVRYQGDEEKTEA